MERQQAFYPGSTYETAPPTMKSYPNVPTAQQPTNSYPSLVIPAELYNPQQSAPAPPVQPVTVQIYPAQSQPIPHLVPPATGWFARNHKNKPQSNSLGAAVLIINTGGMSIAWSTGFGSSQWMIMTMYLRLCWFVAAIIGVLIGAVLVNKLSKKIHMLVSSLMVIIGGILFIACSDDYTAIMIARHINGVAVGLIFVPTLIMAGEESVKYMRGMLASSVESMSFSLGIFLQIIYGTLWTFNNLYTFDSNQMHGLLCAIFGVIALVFAQFMTIESPVYLLVRDQEQEALDSLRRLQRPGLITYETFEQLEAHKSYIAENRTMSFSQSFAQSIPALFKLCIYRGLLAMSFSVIVNTSTIVTSSVSHGLFSWPFIVYGLLRWIGSFVGIFMLDSWGRKKPLAFSMLISGALALGVGVIFSSSYNFLRTSKMSTALILLIVYQFFAGLQGLSSSAYLSEAFPLSVKPYCIAMAFIVEMLVQIITMVAAAGMNSTGISNYFFVLGSFSLIFVVFTILCMPETKNTNLREAQVKFKGLLSTGFQ